MLQLELWHLTHWHFGLKADVFPQKIVSVLRQLAQYPFSFGITFGISLWPLCTEQNTHHFIMNHLRQYQQCSHWTTFLLCHLICYIWKTTKSISTFDFCLGASLKTNQRGASYQDEITAQSGSSSTCLDFVQVSKGMGDGINLDSLNPERREKKLKGWAYGFEGLFRLFFLGGWNLLTTSALELLFVL